MTNTFYNVGKIVNTHGIRGDVKVFRITDFPERFAVGNTVYISCTDRSPMSVTIDRHRVNQGFDLLHFQSYDNINDVEMFKNAYLQITDEQLTTLDAREFYYHEIIGCHVFTVAGEAIGQVTEILAPGANDVWVVKRKGKADALVPYIEDIVKQVDVDQGKIVIEPMEGLLD